MRYRFSHSLGSKCSALAGACFAATAMAFVGQTHAAVYPTGNLLTNPGFENSALTTFTNVTGAPYQTNIWGQESATITTAIAGVTPNGPTHMLMMTNDGTVDTQAIQSVDVSPYSTDINANLVSASFNAQFDTDKSILAGIAGVRLQFFDASHNLLSPTNLDVPFTLDANPNTWEQISLASIPVPVNTNYLLAQVYFNNASMTMATGQFEAGYVDDAVLTLNGPNTPEPGVTMALLPLGGMLLIRRRRRAI